REIVPYIDWSPFFMTWELPGKYPHILDDPKTAAEAKKLFDDANRLLEEIIAHKWLTANAVYGFFPANSEGDDILLYSDDARHHGESASGSFGRSVRRTAARAHTPRMGLRLAGEADEGRVDRGGVSRHPPSGGLSVVSGPHREADAVAAA